jgi:hypothetical protein
VIVVEDDPQGTGDRKSAYHGLIALAGPFVKRGYISNVPYNLTSVVGAIDRILNLPPITDYAATNRPLDDLLTTTANCAPYSVDDSGVKLFPFTPLPGAKAVSDPAHGITSFTEPDHTMPAVAARATLEQLVRTRALGSFANPATTPTVQKVATGPRPNLSTCTLSG